MLAVWSFHTHKGGLWLCMHIPASGYHIILSNKVWYGEKLQIIYLTCNKTPPKHHISSTMLEKSVKHSSSRFSFVLHLSFFSVIQPPQLKFHLRPSIGFLLVSIFHFSFSSPISDMLFSLKFCLEGQHSLKKRLVFWLLFNKAASWGPARHLFLKLEFWCFDSPVQLCTWATRLSLYFG